MNILYDNKNSRLIMIKQKADENYWDKHWVSENVEKQVKLGLQDKIIRKVTEKYLLKKQKVIDAGCGVGQTVYALERYDFDAYGIDFAKETILKTKEIFPELKIFVQDVRKTDFPDNFFEGYWSLGVLEHFWSGYEDIISEAQRIIKPGGYMFVTVPSMSPLRKIKVLLGLYPKFTDKENREPQDFYQFMLNPQIVKNKIEKQGFIFLQGRYYGAVKGLKDEIGWLEPIMRKVYDSNNIFFRGLRFLINTFFDRFAGHMYLFVFKKICQK